MKVRIKRIDKSLPLPVYQTAGAVAFDIYAREGVTIQPQAVVRVPSNLVVQTPEEYMLHLSLRSSTPMKKHGLVIPQGVGVVDSDYCGPEDEVLIQVYNVGDVEVTIERGERFAQGTFVRIDRAEFEELEEITTTSRGGFGSTG